MSAIDNTFNKVRTFLGYLYTVIISFLTITSTPFNIFAYNRVSNFWIHHWASAVRFITGMKISIEGNEHLRTDKPCVLISNHQSLMDIIVLFSISSMNLRMILKKELLYLPIFGWALWWTRFISIDRSSRRKSIQSINKGARKIKKGTSVLLFPEGTRSDDGELQPFQAGSFIMAIKSQVPIIPITISGTINVVHKNTPLKFNYNKEVKVIISPPIDTSNYKLDERDQLKEKVEGIIKENFNKIKYLSKLD